MVSLVSAAPRQPRTAHRQDTILQQEFLQDQQTYLNMTDNSRGCWKEQRSSQTALKDYIHCTLVQVEGITEHPIVLLVRNSLHIYAFTQLSILFNLQRF